MTTEHKFPDIDTSYWHTKDKDWVLERKAQWEIIEPMLAGPKSGKGKTAIKQYFLKGKMPDWDKFRNWNSEERHVDLFMFLWLHPSWDEQILSCLRDQYTKSDLIVYDDVKQGYGIFLNWSVIMACQDYSHESEEDLKDGLHTFGHNELLFKVLMGNLSESTLELEFIDRGLGREKRTFDFPKYDLGIICNMSNWLLIERMHTINENMLFQYDLPLEWWYKSVKDFPYFKKNSLDKQRQYFEKALYRIHHFDTEKEGDTCRTRFVHKIRKILDERDFIPEFKQMWDDVKAGKVEVKDPWKR